MLRNGRSKGADMGAVLDSYGIAADGRDIGRALEQALKEKGRVVLPEGVYLSGPVSLPSSSTLVLEEGAVLRFIPDPSLYPPVYTRWEGVKCFAMHPCVFINESENVTIEGRGTIDGCGAFWWKMLADKRQRGVHAPETKEERMLASLNPGYEDQPGGGGGRECQFLRPPLVQIRKSRNVVIDGITMKDSPFWTVHPLFSEDVTIRNVHIVNPGDAPNTDGIDIESSCSVRVLDSVIDVGDDGIALKSGSGQDGIADNAPTKDVLVRGCIVRSAHGGAVIGSETAAEISHAVFEDCFFDGTDRGIRIKTRRTRGGLIHDAVFRRIRMKDNLIVEAVFYCGIVKDFDVSSLFEKHPEYKVLKQDTGLWKNAELLPQGSGVYFNDDLDLTVEEIWKYGKTVGKVAVEPKYEIAYAISSTREEKGLSQKQLSQLSGVMQCDISRIEGGVANPTIETLGKICKVLGLELSISKPSA